MGQAGRNYPIPRPDTGSDPRLTLGLIYDIADRIEAQGYPPLTGDDFVQLQQVLFAFLYQPAA